MFWKFLISNFYSIIVFFKIKATDQFIIFVSGWCTDSAESCSCIADFIFWIYTVLVPLLPFQNVYSSLLKLVQYSFQYFNFLLSAILVPFVTSSSELGWYHVAGKYASPALLPLCRSVKCWLLAFMVSGSSPLNSFYPSKKVYFIKSKRHGFMNFSVSLCIFQFNNW